jgi:hypothetical protein
VISRVEAARTLLDLRPVLEHQDSEVESSVTRYGGTICIQMQTGLIAEFRKLECGNALWR